MPTSPSAVVIVEGLIGAGKSTFSQELAAALGADTLVLLEPDEVGGQNPYLSDFYADKGRWAYTMQTHLLTLRFRTHLAAQWHAMTGRGCAVIDRSYFGDTCFARMMSETGEISAREFETYRALYTAMTAFVLLPTVCVHLRVSPVVAQRRIQRRAEARTGRTCESVIDLDYLVRLDHETQNMVHVLGGQGVQVLEVNWDEERATPVARAEVIEEVAHQIRKARSPGPFDQSYRRKIG